VKCAFIVLLSPCTYTLYLPRGSACQLTVVRQCESPSQRRASLHPFRDTILTELPHRQIVTLWHCWWICSPSLKIISPISTESKSSRPLLPSRCRCRCCCYCRGRSRYLFVGPKLSSSAAAVPSRSSSRGSLTNCCLVARQLYLLIVPSVILGV
jgi:hypothetical protein